MANSIAYTKNYTAVLDEVYKRAACSTCLNSPRRMARAGRNAKEIMVPKIEVTGLGDYTRNVGYKTGSITYEYETKTFNYDRGIKLLANVTNGAMSTNEPYPHWDISRKIDRGISEQAKPLLENLSCLHNIKPRAQPLKFYSTPTNSQASSLECTPSLP